MWGYRIQEWGYKNQNPKVYFILLLSIKSFDLFFKYTNWQTY